MKNNIKTNKNNNNKNYNNNDNNNDNNNNNNNNNNNDNNNNDNNNNNNNKCPDMLIERDGKIFLYNSKLKIKQNENPLEFKNIDEYKSYIENSKNKCPVLFLQYTTDTQNNELIQIKSSIFKNDGGLPPVKTNHSKNNNTNKKLDEYYEKNKMLDATLDSTPNSDIKFNTNMYSGFDELNQNIGLDTPLDKMFNEKSKKSRNPMDPHWGGKNFTKDAVLNGDYKDREIYRY
tara:strand:- start:1926 stop:2618 length:693 start_codon:yes stop_codon:yes gene_type:complete